MGNLSVSPSSGEPTGSAARENLWKLYGDSLRGRRAWLVKAALIKGLIFWVFGVYCVIGAFRADDLRGLLLWALGAVWSLVIVATIKLWWWMEINRRSIIRSIRTRNLSGIQEEV